MSDIANPSPRQSMRQAIAKAPNRLVVIPGAAIAFAVISWLILRGADIEPRFAPTLAPLLEAAPILQLHIAGAVTAFLLGAIMFALPKGRGLHKPMGWAWVAAMAVTAISSFFLTGLSGDHWSWIHILSAWTVIGLPMGIAAIRRKNIKAHRKHMTNMYMGGMLIAGLFTFLPGRMMWSLFFAY